MQVLVTGAGGKTGSIIARKLLERGASFKARALVRSSASEEGLRQKLASVDAQALEVVHGNVSEPATLEAAFKGIDAVVIVTSAMPQINKLSLAGAISMKLLTLGFYSMRPSFWYPEGESPEHVDWVGQRAQIDAAKAAGVKHIVLVSSMAGTQPGHFLNTHMENIVLWKRKAEKYLIESGVPYTIVHPGPLLPHSGPKAKVPAPGGKRRLHVAVDDELLIEADRLKAEGKEGARSQIPREDVAEVCVLCLEEPAAKGLAFDLGSGPEGEGEAFAGDLKGLLATLEGRSCDFDKPELPQSSL